MPEREGFADPMVEPFLLLVSMLRNNQATESFETVKLAESVDANLLLPFEDRSPILWGNYGDRKPCSGPTGKTGTDVNGLIWGQKSDQTFKASPPA